MKNRAKTKVKTTKNTGVQVIYTTSILLLIAMYGYNAGFLLFNKKEITQETQLSEIPKGQIIIENYQEKLKAIYTSYLQTPIDPESEDLERQKLYATQLKEQLGMLTVSEDFLDLHLELTMHYQKIASSFENQENLSIEGIKKVQKEHEAIVNLSEQHTWLKNNES